MSQQTTRTDVLPERFPMAARLIIIYVAAMPLLAGLPRGAGVPLLRPSEALQLSVAGAAAAIGLIHLASGRRWQLRLRPIEWWMLALATAASILPVLWLLARGLPVGSEALLATFPFVKYALLFFLVRTCVQSTRHVERIATAIVWVACLIAVVAIMQVLTVGPVVDFLGRFYVDGVEDMVDQGRGTTTLGSSIATGALLSFSCGLALSWGLATGRRPWLGASLFLAVGTLASGQAGSVIALGVVVLTVAHLHGRLGQLARWGLPVGAVAMVGLWPVVSARLDDIDGATGLPSSWIVRWNNISELYLPSLGDNGWILGVSPDAILAAPDVWRDVIYLESGYLWLLWVGGLPLLTAAIGFLVTAWRSLGSGASMTGETAPIAIAGKGGVAMMLLLSFIDPHLSLRGGADVFYILVALGLAGTPIAVEAPGTAELWRRRFGTNRERMAWFPAIRVLLSETPAAAGNGEAGLRLTARVDGVDKGDLSIRLFQHHGSLRAVTEGPVHAEADAAAVLWRSLILIADSLRLDELRITAGDERRTGGPLMMPELMGRGLIKVSANLVEKLEIERAAIQHRVQRDGEDPDRAVDRDTPVDLATAVPSASSVTADTPGLRLDVGIRTPLWKRTFDLLIGSVALVATAPLWVVCTIVVRRSSPGPVLYRQLRIGTGGFPFQILKFRTMYVNSDDADHREQNRREILEDAEAVKDDADPRITPIGRLLRRTSLDELPQLVNVLRADMSLVGPRPSLLWETELFRPPTRRRLRSRPGITGLWQVNGRADLSMSEMLELDLDYVDRMGPALDLRCLAKTATSVVAGEGAR